MRILIYCLAASALSLCTESASHAQGPSIGAIVEQGPNPSADDGLKIVFVRHGEKPTKGDNLTCQGLNRALALPSVLYAKFGIPAYTYIPALALGDGTKHARMFQTVTPMAARFNLTLNSSFAEQDSTAMAAELMKKKGMVLVVWEHKAIPTIVRSLGVRDSGLRWDDSDFDSIWIVTFPGGVPTLTRDSEGLHPSEACPD